MTTKDGRRSSLSREGVRSLTWVKPYNHMPLQMGMINTRLYYPKIPQQPPKQRKCLGPEASHSGDKGQEAAGR